MPSQISGIVLDNHRRPVGKVEISVKGKVVARSGDDGSFSINVAKSESRIAVTFAAAGYVSNTRVYDSRVGGGNTVIIWPIAYRVKFDPSRELDIELESSRIQIPANSLTDSSGKKISGAVELQFTLFDVTSPLQRAAASGDFSAQLPDGKIQRLNSYGIFDFDLRDAKQRSLSLRNGAEIEMSIAVPPRLIPRARKEVGFYDFDRLSGSWIHVGTFTFIPGTLKFNGIVKKSGLLHNLDDPKETTCITIQVVNPYTGLGVSGFQVTAQGLQYTETGTTDANGFVCLLVEMNSTFSVTAQGVLAGVFMATPHASNFTSPNFNSGAQDCGNATTCPFIGTIFVDYVIGHLLNTL